MNFNVRQKTHHYDINVVAHKSFTRTTFLKIATLAIKKTRITANNRNKQGEAKTGCEFPIHTLFYLTSCKWDSTLSLSLKPHIGYDIAVLLIREICTFN